MVRPDGSVPIEELARVRSAESFVALNKALVGHRVSSEGLDRKVRVLKDPYRLQFEAPGYLLGYLLLKRLWAVLYVKRGPSLRVRYTLNLFMRRYLMMR
jgi:hypothetical protein